MDMYIVRDISVRLIKCTFVICLIMLGSSYGCAQVNKYEESLYYKEAIKSLENSDITGGIEFLKKEISTHPDNGYAYLHLATIYYESEDYYSALRRINETIENLPSKDKITQAQALTIRSKIKSALEQYDSAIDDLNEAVELCPKNLDILQERASLFSVINEYEKSDVDYRRMLMIQPGSLIAEIGFGRNNIGRKKYEEAISHFDKMICKLPDYSLLYIYRSEAYLGLGNVSEAIDDIIKSIDIDQNYNVNLLFPFLNHENKGLLLSKFNNKYKSERSNLLWPLYIGYIMEMNGEHLSAISYYESSFNLKKTSFCAQRLAECYKELRDWANAVLYIDRAISLDRNNLQYLYDKATICWYADSISEAIAIETKCIEAQPDYFFHYYRRGWYKHLIGDFNGALEDYTESLSRNPEYAYAYCRRGRLYLKFGLTQKAQSDFGKCVKYDSVPSEHSCAPYALFFLGNISEAKEFMNIMLKEYPNESYYDAACLYSLMDLKDAALDYLEKALESGYNNYNHILKDLDLYNIRRENRFKQLYERYSNNTYIIENNIDEVLKDTHSVMVDNNIEDTYIEQTISIPYTITYGITKVEGCINGYTTYLSYIPKQEIVISAYQAEYFLSNGYISKSDCSGLIGPNGKIPVGSTIRFESLKIGEESFSNIKAIVVGNDQSPLVFGDKIFGTTSIVRKDENLNIIEVTKTTKTN